MINTAIKKVTDEIPIYKNLLAEAEKQLEEAKKQEAFIRANRLQTRVVYFKNMIEILESDKTRLTELKEMPVSVMLRNRMIPANKYGGGNV